MTNILYYIKKLLPKWLYLKLQKPYHFGLAFLGAVYYRHPSRDLFVIGVTGTKGKSSTVEIITHLLRTHGIKTASLSTIQFSVDTAAERNLYKMTMPGRFFTQHFLRRAVSAGCTHAVVEMTSEGAKQFRHRFIEIDALVFTNLTPEHIESHGSFANYKAAKLTIAQAVADSKKRPRFLAANIDDEHGKDFLDFPVEHTLPYTLSDLDLYSLQKDGCSLVLENVTMRAPLIGLFNVYNILASITMVRALGVPLKTIQTALQTLPPLPGRVQQFTSPTDSPKKVTVVVDYAHTPDSLRQLYEAFPEQQKIGVLGNTGGGRDTWKRPEMGALAEHYCAHVILTNEDPYDEDPLKILEEMRRGMTDDAPVEIILDRRTAIQKAIAVAPENGYVLVSGKGTDPYIMGPNDSRQPWSDAAVVEELLAELVSTTPNA